MGTKNDIEQAFRAALKVGVQSTPITDDSYVIISQTEGPRPGHDYMTVDLTSPDIEVGYDELLGSLDASDNPQVAQRGDREATVTINFFGESADAWSETFKNRLYLPAVTAIFSAAKMSVEPMGSPINATKMLQTSWENRIVQEFRVRYRLTSADEALTELLHVELDMNHEPGSVTMDVTIDL